MEPAEFDKQFLAIGGSRHEERPWRLRRVERRLKTVSMPVQEQRLRRRDQGRHGHSRLVSGLCRRRQRLRVSGQAYLAKDNKAAAIDELERYVKAGGRNPDTIKLLAKRLTDAGNKKEAAAVLDRLNYIYPMDNDLHQGWARCGSTWATPPAPSREFHAVLAHNPIDPAQAHYDLARAYRLNHQPEQAKDELLAALEAAPGYRPAQKLLLELSGRRKPNAP